MVTERESLGKIEVLELGQIQLREDTVIERDGVELIRTFRRRVLVPGSDVSGEIAVVRRVAMAVWTPQVVSNYQARVAVASKL